MLIIFDLDDTLINTSKEISPFQISRTFMSLMQQGLKIENPTEELNKILTDHQKTKKSLRSLENFLNSISAEDIYYQIAKKNISALLPDSFVIQTFRGVKEILESLSTKANLCMVTMGHDDYQKQKIQKAGIDSSIFSKIIITREKNKKIHYKKLMRHFNSSGLIVCGDRVDVDLEPAKELGGITICVEESGRPIDQRLEKFLDYKVKYFFQVKPIIEKILR